jgi:bifunctional UDP-N-acetylglucosamine pyrophosphorylase/glucosamine-1-phosphate N-acetyltransferase
MSKIDVVIMAAGKGTRMKSSMPKVLHRLGGRALLQHVIDTAQHIQARRVVVITGHGAEQVEAELAPQSGLESVRQMPQLGTGHAMQQAVPLLDDDGVTLVLSGDVPLIQADTLLALLKLCDEQHLALLTLQTPAPAGYGRILRNPQQQVIGIVEEKDASEAQKKINEIYSGIMAVPTRMLRGWLARLDNRNAQGEFYLTDVVGFAVADACEVKAHGIDQPWQVEGVNTPVQLAALERTYQQLQAQQLMQQGVRLADPARIDVRGELVCGADVEIDVNNVFEGRVTLGEGVRIGPHCVIINAEIGAGTQVLGFTYINGEDKAVRIGSGARIGPFARLRPGADLGDDVHIGNFVEVKNSTLAKGAKANHLAYLGDLSVGERVNYGAGVISANYDGANKHHTTIEADVHIGSNSVLVSPLTVGAGGAIGAGSVITKDTAPGALTVARGKQVSIPNWQRPVKKNK